MNTSTRRARRSLQPTGSRRNLLLSLTLILAACPASDVSRKDASSFDAASKADLAADLTAADLLQFDALADAMRFDQQTFADAATIAGCSDSCATANDARCDDGGAYSDSALCGLGTDCSDCGPRGALASCGNAIRESGEGCDDGNSRGGDGCDRNCQVENGWSCQSGPA